MRRLSSHLKSFGQLVSVLAKRAMPARNYSKANNEALRSKLRVIKAEFAIA